MKRHNIVSIVFWVVVVPLFLNLRSSPFVVLGALTRR